MVAYHCASSTKPPDRIDAALSLFRDSLKFLAGNEWSSSQVTLRGASSADAAWPLPSLVDGDINLAASLSLAAAAELSDCATRALEAIRRDAPPGAFSLLFTPRKRQYDLTVKVPLVGGDDAYTAALATDDDDAGILGLTIPQAVGRRVCATVERALAGRLRRPPRWDCAGASIVVGASLSTDAWRQVLKGGAPSTDEGRSFRAFWGDRCQARRFKDGRVLEAVVRARRPLGFARGDGVFMRVHARRSGSRPKTALATAGSASSHNGASPTPWRATSRGGRRRSTAPLQV